MNNKDSHVQIDSGKKTGDFSFDIREVLLIFITIFLVFLIYSNSLQGPFIFDDLRNIKDNPHIQLADLTFEGIRGAGSESPLFTRQVAYISFTLNYYLHQYNVLGYHLVNILIHVAAGVFLFLFLKTTLNLPPLRSRYEPHRWIPLVAVIIWLVHPIQTQSVTYIVQRMNSMAAMFYVLAFLLYSRARLAEDKRKKWALFAGCAFSGLLSLGSKEIAATLPFFIVLYEWYFLQDMSWSWLKRRLFLFVGVLVLFAVMALVYLGVNPVERILSGYATRDFTLGQRVLTEFRVVIFYISLLLFPHPSRLNLEHDFAISHSLLEPITTLLSMGGVLGLIGLAVYLARKDRLLSFCILWFFGNLVIESSVIGLEIIFEHRIYLPSMLAMVLAVVIACRYIERRWLGAILVCGVVVVFSFWTYERNSVWSDKVTLWRDCVAKSPNKARSHNNLGVALVKQGKIDEAITHFSKGFHLKPTHKTLYNNLQQALLEKGTSYNNLGFDLFKKGRTKEAIVYYRKALQTKPDFAPVHYNLGVALDSQGKIDEAIRHYFEVLRLDPDNEKAHNNLGNALFKKGRVEEAIGHYQAALKIKPDYFLARKNLMTVLARQGRSVEAVSKTKGAPGITQENPGLNIKSGN